MDNIQDLEKFLAKCKETKEQVLNNPILTFMGLQDIIDQCAMMAQDIYNVEHILKQDTPWDLNEKDIDDKDKEAIKTLVSEYLNDVDTKDKDINDVLVNFACFCIKHVES